MVSLAIHQTTTEFKAITAKQFLILKKIKRYSRERLRLDRFVRALPHSPRARQQDVYRLQREMQELRNHCVKLLEENQRLAYEVNHDSLTGLYNRRYFDNYCPQACQTAAAMGHQLSLLVLDIDHFKAYNDTHSHQAGDQLLQRLGQYLLAQVQTAENCVARYGGEEFVVVLPRHDFAAAYAIAQTIQTIVSTFNITVSIGIACYGIDGATPKDLFSCADRRLYAAKQNGRNCIVGSME
ncbi:GGDEF domain-containing protein [Leptothoe kymatousa]|uniref:GGDEF domain-containing protein n=1 Tax=Leptothoe kymatousa TAU-MAC 1615 TaxID=2364775 RepID=A0ABS5Y101_9CYAN|nr:GGDEF domain-containing protein [Leptothoe kymatousa]MBT9311493.1 GGDEF domain-containing protein [Leptothoe kymatousa TAU-MAC 1615]